MKYHPIKHIMFQFEAILCLCSEGPEFMNKLELMDAIKKDAARGYNLCNDWIIKQIEGDYENNH